MKKISRGLLVLLVSALPAWAQFEGVMDMKMTLTDPSGANQGGGDIVVSVGKPGFRSDLNMQMPQMSMKMVMLFKESTPDVMYQINDEAKSYSEIPMPKNADAAKATADADKYTVKKLGEEKILGYKTQHVLAIHNGSTNELWLAKDFLDYNMFKRLQGRQAQAGLEKALKDAGVEGMPLKSIMPGPMGGKMTMEVVKADKKSLPASTFDIPAGYTKSEGGLMNALSGASGPQVDAAKKQMEEAMKNMTPEQRKQLEEIMKRRGAQPPQ
jgi:hypothetical protein